MCGRKWIGLLALCGGVWILCQLAPLPMSLYLKAEPTVFNVCEFSDPGYRKQTLTQDELDTLTALLSNVRVQWRGRPNAYDDTPTFYLYQAAASDDMRTGTICSLSYSKSGDLYLNRVALHPVGEPGKQLLAFLSSY